MGPSGPIFVARQALDACPDHENKKQREEPMLDTSEGVQPWPAAVLALVALAVWWIGGPYTAFDHDGVYYAAEALRRLDPALLSVDPFFLGGSQGDFSIFVSPYALLVRWLGLSQAALGVTVVWKWLWVLAACLLLASLSRSRAEAYVALGVGLVLPRLYEPSHVFAYAEPFATPRLVAECLTLFALTTSMRGRPLLALGLALLATATHPLIGWPALAICLLIHVAFRTGRFQWRIALAVVLGCTALGAGGAAIGTPVLERLLQRYDDAWWAVVSARNFFALAQGWPAEGLLGAACWLLLLAFVARQAPEPIHKLGISTALVGALAVGAWIAGSYAHDVLLVQLQPWRVMWIVQWLMPCLWALHFVRVGLAQPAEQILLMLVAAAVLCTNAGAVVLTGLVFLRLTKGAAIDARVSPTLQRSLAAILLTLILATRLTGLGYLKAAASALAGSPVPTLQALAWEPAFWFPAGAAVLWAASKWPWRAPAAWALQAGACVTAATGFAFWLAMAAQRLEPTAPWIASLRRHIPVNATVYWQVPLDKIWLDLQRSSYASHAQGASVLFSRPMALELQRRLERLRILGLAGGPSAWADLAGAGRLDGRRAPPLCEDSALDFVIVPGSWPQAELQLPGPSSETLSIFECQRHRPQRSEAAAS
jgi:hypothetical protein